MLTQKIEYPSIPDRNIPDNRGINFRGFQQRLIANLRDRVRAGEITERGLARLTGVSQPHMHHVLNGKRAASPDMADKILRQLRMDLLDLIEPREFLAWRRRGVEMMK